MELCGNWQANSKICIKNTKGQESRTILENNKVVGLTLLDIKTIL